MAPNKERHDSSFLCVYTQGSSHGLRLRLKSLAGKAQRMIQLRETKTLRRGVTASFDSGSMSLDTPMVFHGMPGFQAPQPSFGWQEGYEAEPQSP
jgi:hypothetical protein